MKNVTVLILILLIACSSFSVLPIVVRAQAGEVVLKPTDDTYIDRVFDLDGNYGSSEFLRVCLTHYRTWLKFNLSSIPEGALGISAVLELYTTYGGVTDPHYVVACFGLNNSWSESTLTARNTPFEFGTELDTEEVWQSERWYEWNATEAVVAAATNHSTAVTIFMRYPYGVDAPSVTFTSKEGSMTKFPKLTVSWTGVIPEFPTFLTLPLLMIATLVAVVIRREYRENMG